MPPRILSGGDNSPSPQGGSFISKVPTWVWYGVGIVAALFIFMRLRGGASSGSTQSGSPIAAGADSSMLGGPAAPSTLGITSPSGASINLGNVSLTPEDVAAIIKSMFPGPATQTGTPIPTPNPQPIGPANGLQPWPVVPINPAPITPARKWTTVGHWPNWDGSLSGISSHYRLPLTTVEKLNPQLQRGGHNWNLIYPGEKVWLS